MVENKIIQVMIVDDSAVVRGMLTRALNQEADINVASSLMDGEVAIANINKQPIDVIILDLEMPRMDGLTALPLLSKACPTAKIIISSSLTEENASVSMKALANGAAEILAKPSARLDKEEIDKYYKNLLFTIRALAGKKESFSVRKVLPQTDFIKPASNTDNISHILPTTKISYPNKKPRALAIASSTGGPQALNDVLSGLKNNLLNVPIFITQHMPPTFTTILARNLSQVIGRDCVEGAENMEINSGGIYIAPGDFHMLVERKNNKMQIHLDSGAQVNFCRPAADPMIESLVKIYGNELLLVVLTGMGSDGIGGAKILHATGGSVVAQDKDSCVVWGMPRAVTEANLCSAVLPLDQISAYIVRAFGG